LTCAPGRIIWNEGAGWKTAEKAEAPGRIINVVFVSEAEADTA
jgi:hypothetical protein